MQIHLIDHIIIHATRQSKVGASIARGGKSHHAKGKALCRPFKRRKEARKIFQ
jgi:hypothetical protein